MDPDFIDDDQILPTRIEHRCECILNAGAIEQRYNYLVYQFERASDSAIARAYLDQIDEVSILQMGGKLPVGEMRSTEFWRDVLAYLRRRYDTVTALGEEGYAPV